MKSAYYTARGLLGCAEHPVVQRVEVWKLLWYAKVMPKIKYFMWRWLQGLLPVFDVLARRGMAMSSNCCICSKEEDCFKHVFAFCDFTKAAWDLFHFLIDAILELDVPNFCMEIVRKASAEDILGKVCCFLWWLWTNRNTYFHEQKCFLALTLVDNAHRYF